MNPKKKRMSSITLVAQFMLVLCSIVLGRDKCKGNQSRVTPEETSENRIRLLEGYSTLYIQVWLSQNVLTVRVTGVE